MKKLALLAALLLTSLALGADDVTAKPLTKAEVNSPTFGRRVQPDDCFRDCKEVHCAKEVICKNLIPPKDCPACNCKCEPAPSVTIPGPPVAVPSDCTASAPEIRYVTSSVPPHGRWFIPVSLARLDGYSNRSSYLESLPHQPPEDPSITVEHDAVWGVGGGLGYQWANGVSLSGQYLFLESGSASVRFSHAPDSRLEAHGLRVEADAPRGLWIATVAIPLGKQ